MENKREEFISTLKEEYTNYCKATGEAQTIDGYSKYILKRNLINERTINRFLVITKYPTLLAQNMGIKKCAIYSLEDKTGLSFTGIKYIIKRFSNAF